MATINIITGNFLEAMDEIKADVVVSFMTERGILWGFSKLLAAEYVEVSDMLKVNHAEVIGKWQYKPTYSRTMVMAYISAPASPRLYQRSTNGHGLRESMTSLIRTMASSSKRVLMVQYPGMTVCGVDIYGFQRILAEARAGFDIDIHIPVNPIIGQKYQPAIHVKHYDSRTRVRQPNHVNFIEESSDFDLSGFNRQQTTEQSGFYNHQSVEMKSAHHVTNHY